jgi:uncharacterized short protein YbdD (DUF466 family)
MWRSNRWRAELARRCLAAWRGTVRAARLAVGVPDYDAYVAHMRSCHSERAPMDLESFHRERMLARYGRRTTRCC